MPSPSASSEFRSAGRDRQSSTTTASGLRCSIATSTSCADCSDRCDAPRSKYFQAQRCRRLQQILSPGGSQRRAHAERRKHFSSARGGRYLCSVFVRCTEEPTKSRQWFRVPVVRHTKPRSIPEWRAPGTHTKTNGCVERSTYTVTNVDDQCGAPLAPRFRGDRTPCAATVGHESWQRLNQRS